MSAATSLFSIVCGGQLQVTYFRRLGLCTHMWFISSNMADHVYHPTRFNNIQYDRLSICFQYVSSFFTLKLNRTIITSTLSSLPPPPLSLSLVLNLHICKDMDMCIHAGGICVVAQYNQDKHLQSICCFLCSKGYSRWHLQEGLLSCW